MPATTLKLSPELRSRIAEAAKNSGTTPHAFMVKAVEHQTALAEQRQSFLADARAGERQVLEAGKALDADEVHAYFRARVKGKKAARPRLKAWRG